MIDFHTCAFRTDLTADKSKRKKRRELTEEQKDEIKEAFELFDTDKDKEIDYHELKVNILFPKRLFIIFGNVHLFKNSILNVEKYEQIILGKWKCHINAKQRMLYEYISNSYQYFQ